ncbi:protein UNUSUAL FLORAL ORGANS-like [Chenopodium quinoa]|uniref:protein UNUSUAL FLORAL ORGANS-like n=1 Tax=Chenopodium quinoa TaxID=63459 RepID=UPI000B79AAA5|nr:protein UNUSUAL FLORAL ORGANS-like [Chenopodium quinoa]
METFNQASIAIPFPYNYGITNVPTFAPTFHPYTTITTTFPPPPPPTTPTTITTSSWMDSRLWSRLPQQLVDRILAFLPLPAFFRARSVCKRWYALLYSNSFLQLYLQVSPCHHWFIFFTHKTPNTSTIYRNNFTNLNNNGDEQGDNVLSTRAYLFDPYEVKWYIIPFSIIPLGFSPATTSGGLVCWVSDEPGLKNLFLHNPLLGSVTQLPPTRRPRLFPSVGLSVTTASVDLILAGDDMISPYAVKNLTAESFHIDSSGFYSVWDTTSSLPRLCSLESGQMLHSDGRFYCMNYSPFSVLAYDVSSNAWWKIQAPMRRFLRSPCLVESKDRLILVAAVEKSKLNVPRSLRMWVLQGCGSQWAEIERMPQQLYAQFEEIEGGRGFDCVGSGEFIVIMIKGVINKGLMFDIERKRWIWMPCCPSNGNLSCEISSNLEGNLHGFAYQPTLAAPVTALVHQLASSSLSEF